MGAGGFTSCYVTRKAVGLMQTRHTGKINHCLIQPFSYKNVHGRAKEEQLVAISSLQEKATGFTGNVVRVYELNKIPQL